MTSTTPKGARVADARTLRETGTVIDADAERVAVVWDRNANGWNTYAADTVTVIDRDDADARALQLTDAVTVAHAG